MSHNTFSAIHCINPDCQRPYPQLWGQKFCNSCGAPLQLLNRYVPIQRLGSGGFAQIYTLWDEKTQTEKVLKVLVEQSPKALELFYQEAEVLKSLRHPGVPKVDADGYFQLDLFNPQPRQLSCLVMEKIHGQTLEEILQNYPGGCPEELVLNWLAQTVKILQELHKRQIIHRDIKPSNLMLRSTPLQPLPLQSQTQAILAGELVLIDFGGAKQFNRKMQRQESSSTRLYSSGYSPPEQIIGSNIGPAADFYALGRTMIELLTGKYPVDLEDPHTGEFRWRTLVNVRPQLADLLDDMVVEDAIARPRNAAIIQRRLGKISQPSPTPGFFRQINQAIGNAITGAIKFILKAIADYLHFLGKTTIFIFKTIVKVLRACVETIWTMILTGIGASLGAIAGFILAYHTVLGDRLANFLAFRLPELSGNTEPVFGSQILFFAMAGLATSWGLTAAGGFGQQRRYLVASIMGIIGYSFSWFLLQLITPKEGLVISILVAVFLLILGLGLRSHHIVYALITALGTALIFAGLIHLVGFPAILFNFSNPPLWSDLVLPITFFSFTGVFLSFWLGVTHYLIVPGLRFLGWR